MIQTSDSSDSQSTCSDDKAVSKAETYANGSIRCRLAPAKMLKQIAAVLLYRPGLIGHWIQWIHRAI